MVEKVYVSWSEVNHQINSLLIDIASSGNKYTQIVGIKNGGAYPGQRIAMMLGIPYTEIRVSFYNKDDKKGTMSEDSINQFEFDQLFDWNKEKVLFVDDLVDSGSTFTHIFNYLSIGEHSPAKHGFACLYHSTHSSSIGGVFVGSKKPDAWIVLPWETTEQFIKVAHE
jgi:hypoxanthine phosphoribosyltransferase